MVLVVVLTKIFLLNLCVVDCCGFSLLRQGGASNGKRNLQGPTADKDGKDMTTSTSYTGYTANEVPAGNKSPQADAADYLRNGDQCLKGGTISRSNCGSVPDCSFTGQFGPAKLCINRLPNSDGVWYVGAMKCIPQWENCDKCMCGLISSEGADSTCKFNGQTPDDDSTKVDCSNLSSATINGVSFNVGASSNQANAASTSNSGKTSDKATEREGPDQRSPPAPAQLNTVKQESQTNTRSILFAVLGLISAASLLAFTIVKIVKRRKMKSMSKEAHDGTDQQNNDTPIHDSTKGHAEHLELTEEGKDEF